MAGFEPAISRLSAERIRPLYDTPAPQMFSGYLETPVAELRSLLLNKVRELNCQGSGPHSVSLRMMTELFKVSFLMMTSFSSSSVKLR